MFKNLAHDERASGRQAVFAVALFAALVVAFAALVIALRVA